MPDLKRILIYDPNTDKDAVVNPDGDLVVTLDGEGFGFVPEAYDYLSLTEATLTDTYTYKTGGSGGTTVATLTITYTDSGKGTIANVART